MILALLLLAGMADWVPAHWISSDPQSLNLVEGSGVNCLLIESAALTQDFVQQARKRGLATVAVVRPGSAALDQALRAARLPVSAVVLEGDFEADVVSRIRNALTAIHVTLIELPERRNIRLDSHDPIVGTWQGLFPGIEIEHGGTVSAGPTSNPWINTNTGFLHFLRAAVDGALWLSATPPPRTVLPMERYAMAIADAEAAGARWIVTLDADLQKRLLAGDSRAVQDWKQIGAYVRYFEGHPEWRVYRQFSRLALLQDADSGGLLSASLLDLMSAQHVAARAIPPRRLSDASLDELRTVVNIAGSEAQPDALAKFEQSGGVLLSPPPGWRLGADTPGNTAPNRNQLKRIQDIWEMLYNATARKNFGARSFNTAGILFNVLSSPDEKSLLIHLVNYTGYGADDITVHALGTWKRARLYRPDAPVREMAVYPVKDGTGVDLDKLGVVASLVFD